MAIIKSKKLRKVLRVAAIATAAYFGAPYLLAAGSSVASGASTALGAGIAGRIASGGQGRAPPESAIPAGGTFINIGTPGFSGPAASGAVGYSDIGAGGAGSQIFPGGPFDAPAGASFSPGLILGIAGAGLGIVLLIMLIRR